MSKTIPNQGEVNYLDLCGRIMFFRDQDSGLFWGVNLGKEASFLLVPEDAVTGTDQQIGKIIREKMPLLVLAEVDQIAHLVDNCGFDRGTPISTLERNRDMVKTVLAEHPEYQPTFDAIHLQIEARKAKEANSRNAIQQRKNLKDRYDQVFMSLGRRYGFQCLSCGATRALVIDHIIALTNGGTSEFDNLQILCEACNLSKGIKTVDFRPKDSRRPVEQEVDHVS